jgi:hypothetical protein
MNYLPKILKSNFVLSLVFFCFSNLLFSQLSFVLSGTLCSGNALILSANTSSFPATTFTWSSAPSGPVFTSTSSSNAQVLFPTAGLYTITLGGSAGNVSAYTSNTILILPTPVLTVSASDATICSGQIATLIAVGASSYTWDPLPGLVVAYAGTAYVAPSVTTVYSVSGSNSSGCSSGTTYTITYVPFPNLTLAATNTSICSGYDATLTAFGAANYTWTGTTFSGTSNQVTLAVTAGTYSLIGSNGGGCVDSTFITIGLFPPLSLSISLSRDRVCKDDGDSLVPVTLSGSGAVTYVWQPYNPAYMTYSLGSSTAVTPSATTCYTLTGTNAICTGTTTTCINVGTCAALQENKTEELFSFYPNPIQERLNVVFNSQEVFTIELADFAGKLIVKQTFDAQPGNLYTINMGELSAGLYFLRVVRIGKIIQSIKLIRE